MPDMPAIAVLGRKLDSIPFSPYHIAVILVLGLVGFTDGYDLALTGSLLVLAKGPLHITPDQIRLLTIAATMFVVVGGFISAAISDHVSRKTIIQIGVVSMTFFTLLIPFVQTAEQLIVVRLLTGLGLGFAITAPFPVAAELMPAQHRRTYGAIYEICLASAFVLLPLVGGLLAGSENGFRWIALPGGLALFVVPIMVHLVIPQSARWQLRHGRTAEAVATVNLYIQRCGNKIPPLTVAELGSNLAETREKLPRFAALFAFGQFRWTAVGILTSMCAGTAYYLIAILLPKALIEQGSAVTTGFAITTIVFLATIPGKAFNAVLMERWGRRWAIAYAMSGAFPGLILMATAHLGGDYAGIMMTAGAGLHRAVVVHHRARLFVGAVPDRAARPRQRLRRGFRPHFRRRAGAVLDGAACRRAVHLLRHHRHRRDVRRVHPGAVRQGNGRPARVRDRARHGARTRGVGPIGAAARPHASSPDYMVITTLPTWRSAST
jgi:MFS family permease